MTSELIALVVRANLAASAAVIVVLAMRMPVARRLGARAAYALWSAVPLAAVACLIPARIVTLQQTAAPAGGVVAHASAAPTLAATTVSHGAASWPSLGAFATVA